VKFVTDLISADDAKTAKLNEVPTSGAGLDSATPPSGGADAPTDTPPPGDGDAPVAWAPIEPAPK
jgi:hypothetical protein